MRSIQIARVVNLEGCRPAGNIFFFAFGGTPPAGPQGESSLFKSAIPDARPRYGHETHTQTARLKFTLAAGLLCGGLLCSLLNGYLCRRFILGRARCGGTLGGGTLGGESLCQQELLCTRPRSSKGVGGRSGAGLAGSCERLERGAGQIGWGPMDARTVW